MLQLKPQYQKILNKQEFDQLSSAEKFDELGKITFCKFVLNLELASTEPFKNDPNVQEYRQEIINEIQKRTNIQ